MLLKTGKNLAENKKRRDKCLYSMTLQSTPGNLFLENSSQRKQIMPKDDQRVKH